MSDSEKENIEKVEGRREREWEIVKEEKDEDKDTFGGGNGDGKDEWTAAWISSSSFRFAIDFVLKVKEIEWKIPDVFEHVGEGPFPQRRNNPNVAERLNNELII